MPLRRDRQRREPLVSLAGTSLNAFPVDRFNDGDQVHITAGVDRGFYRNRSSQSWVPVTTGAITVLRRSIAFDTPGIEDGVSFGDVFAGQWLFAKFCSIPFAFDGEAPVISVGVPGAIDCAWNASPTDATQFNLDDVGDPMSTVAAYDYGAGSHNLVHENAELFVYLTSGGDEGVSPESTHGEATAMLVLFG